jgi:DNA polymerase III subunit delta'
VSLFDADDYLTPSDEPAEVAPQPPDEAAPPVAALLETLQELPPDTPEFVVDSVLEEVAIVEVGPPVPVPIARVSSSVGLWDEVRFQDAAVAALRAAARQPVHAYLLVGRPGNGTMRAALSFGAALLCPNGGCSVCDVCLRARDQVHPDLIVVEREGASINVDQAREIIRLAMRSPVEGSRKVLVLTDFHLVTNAGPTLLKIIEEPPASTIFVILADHLPPELVTIASRCVQIPFVTPTGAQIISALIDIGLSEERAAQVAAASGGQLERALLLASDDHLAGRVAFWDMIPSRLDGSGAAVSSLAGEALALLDNAAVGPLEARQATEVAALEARIEQTGTRGAIGQRKELTERHKRELKRLRDDELRLGLSVLQRRFHTALVNQSIDDGAAIAAVEAIGATNEHLERNPNLALALPALLLKLPPLGERLPAT